MKKIIALLFITLTGLITTVSVKADYVSISHVTDLNQIPHVTGDLMSAKDSSKVGYAKFVEKQNGHEVQIHHPNGTTYILSSSSNTPMPITLPGINDYANLLLNSGVLFRGSNGEKLLYYEFQNPANAIDTESSIFEATEEEIQKYGFRPYVIWDVETGIYDVTDKLTLYGIHHAGKDRRAYADIVFPMDIDSLLMIEMSWKYRYEMLWLGWTDWRYDYAVRYQDEKVKATNFWHEYKKVLFLDYWYKPSAWAYWKPERFNTQTIQDLGQVNDRYKSDYITKLNKHRLKENKDAVSINDIFSGPKSYSVQRVYLNTYSAGFYTDYEVDDVVIISLAYNYDGEYFAPVIEDVEWYFVGGKGNEDNDWWRKTLRIVLVVGGILLLIRFLEAITKLIRG